MNRKRWQVALSLGCGLLFAGCAVVQSEVGGGRGKRQGPLLLSKGGRTPGGEQRAAQFLGGLQLGGAERQEMAKAVVARHWAAAMRLAKAYLQGEPFDLGALMVLATAHTAEAQFDLAAHYARLVLQHQPEHPGALNILGLERYANAASLHDYREALATFARAFAKSPSEIAAGLNLAYLYLDLGHARNAQQTFSKLRRRCDDCTEALAGYGVATARLGENEEARDALESVLARDPENVTALYQLALYYRNIAHDEAKTAGLVERILAHKGPELAETREKSRLLLPAAGDAPRR